MPDSKTKLTLSLPAEALAKILADPEAFKGAMQKAGFDVLSVVPHELTHYPNGQPMFDASGMMLDEHGARSIFDDVDQ